MAVSLHAGNTCVSFGGCFSTFLYLTETSFIPHAFLFGVLLFSIVACFILLFKSEIFAYLLITFIVTWHPPELNISESKYFVILFNYNYCTDYGNVN